MSARRIGAATLLVVGTLLWSAAIFGVWAQRQALDTDNWVSTSSRLLEDDQIRNALAVALIDRLYDANSVEQRLRESLPPRLDPLAAPAASGLREVALRNAPRVLGTGAALQAWQTANRGAHAAFLALVDGRLAPGGQVTLDVQGLVRRVATSTGLPAGVADKLPPRVARLQLMKSDELGTAQKAVAFFRDAVWFLIIAAVAAFAGAIALAGDRRHSVLTVGMCLMIASILVLAVRHVAGAAVVDSLADAPNAHAVADDVWSIATSLLVDAAQGSFLFGALVASAAWVAGPGRMPTSVRRVNAPALRERAALTRAGLAVALLLLVWWGPVPWTERVVPVLLVTVAAFAWLEWLRRRSSVEFADVAPGELGRTLRTRDWFARSKPDDTDTAHA
jgi:hypothetical protein